MAGSKPQPLKLSQLDVIAHQLEHVAHDKPDDGLTIVQEAAEELRALRTLIDTFGGHFVVINNLTQEVGQ